MVLTRSFKVLMQKRDNPAFGRALLRESIDGMLASDVETGKTILRGCITATVGFGRLGAETGTKPKSLRDLGHAVEREQLRALLAARIIGG